MSIKGFHSCRKEWAINGQEKRIQVSRFLGDAVLKVVAFKDIAVKSTADKSTLRYQKADVRFPCILVEGGDNPLGKPYRMCDGRHRISKLKEQGHTEAVFFILSNEKFITIFNKTNNVI
jgi:hypothetical protein